MFPACVQPKSLETTFSVCDSGAAGAGEWCAAVVVREHDQVVPHALLLRHQAALLHMHCVRHFKVHVLHNLKYSTMIRMVLLV